MASTKAWDGSASNYSSTEAFCSACLIDDNPDGQRKVQSLRHLPVKEPGGALNANAVHNAASRLNQLKVSPASKKKAARALVRLYGQLKEPVPEVVKRTAQ